MTKITQAHKAEARRLEQLERERELSLGLMKDPGEWPVWPRLPVKSRTKKDPGGLMQLGVMLDGYGATVYLGTMFDDLSKAPTLQYATFEAAVDDGWVVD